MKLKNRKKIFIIMSMLLIVVLAGIITSCGLVKTFIMVADSPQLLTDYLLNSVEGAEEVLAADVEEGDFAGVIDLTADSTANVTLDINSKSIVVPSIYKADSSDDISLGSYLVKVGGSDKTLRLPVDENGNLNIKFDQNTLDYFNAITDDGTSDAVVSMAPIFSDTPASSNSRATVFQAADYKLGKYTDWVFKKNNVVKNGNKYLFVQGMLTNLNKCKDLSELKSSFDVQTVFFVLKANENQTCELLKDDDYHIYNISHKYYIKANIGYDSVFVMNSFFAETEEKSTGENGVKIITSSDVINTMKNTMNETTIENIDSYDTAVAITDPSISESVAGSAAEKAIIDSIMPNSFIRVDKKY